MEDAAGGGTPSLVWALLQLKTLSRALTAKLLTHVCFCDNLIVLLGGIWVRTQALRFQADTTSGRHSTASLQCERPIVACSSLAQASNCVAPVSMHCIFCTTTLIRVVHAPPHEVFLACKCATAADVSSKTARSICAVGHSPDFRHLCAGTMVTRDWFITAAHCFINTPLPFFYRVQVGATTLVGGDVGERRLIAQIVVHPSYDECVAPRCS